MSEWHRIETAPKDGSPVILKGRTVYPCVEPDEDVEYESYWASMDGLNDGGWVWYGASCVEFTHWKPKDD